MEGGGGGGGSSLIYISIAYFMSKWGQELLVERQNGKRGLESGFGSAGYVNGF